MQGNHTKGKRSAMDLISRQAAIEACYDGLADCRDDCAENIRNLPSADVRPVVRGRWKQTGGKYSRHKTRVVVGFLS